jgi:NTE family protein
MPLRRLLAGELGEHSTFADLKVPFRCCAASIERAAEHWFDSGPLVDAVLASSAVPGLLPPMRIGDEHFVDGGIVNSIPIGEAVRVGAKLIFVLQVGRVERPLTVPRRPWEVAQVAFEIARRHRFARELAALPDDVRVHVLPTGGGDSRDDSPWAYRDLAAVGRRISRAYTASRRYLAANLPPGPS